MSLSVFDRSAAAARRAPRASTSGADGNGVFMKFHDVPRIRGRTSRNRMIGRADRFLSPEIHEYFLVAALGARTTRGSVLGHCGFRDRSATFSRADFRNISGNFPEEVGK